MDTLKEAGPTKSTNKPIGLICLVVVIGIIVIVAINLGGSKKLDGTYYSSNGLYYVFTENGNFAMAFVGGTEMRVGATGTYELNGETLTIYIQYNGSNTVEKSVCKYNKSSDTITNPSGLVFRRQK